MRPIHAYLTPFLPLQSPRPRPSAELISFLHFLPPVLPRPPFFFSRAIELYVPPWRPPQPPALLPLATYYRGRAQCQVCGAGLPFRACRDGWFFLSKDPEQSIVPSGP